MCNLYRLQADLSDVAAHFGIPSPPDVPALSETQPGHPGLIVRGPIGRRVILPALWGFPRPQTDRKGQLLHEKPVNLVADLTNPMWDRMVADPRYRCLIPLTGFAQPDGPRGAMTRTWFGVVDRPIFTWAGFCRNTEAWGPVYAGMTTDSNTAVAPLNPRMPVLLMPDEYQRWLEGSIDDVIEFQFRAPFPSDRLTIERTRALWLSRRRPAAHGAAVL